MAHIIQAKQALEEWIDEEIETRRQQGCDRNRQYPGHCNIAGHRPAYLRDPVRRASAHDGRADHLCCTHRSAHQRCPQDCARRGKLRAWGVHGPDLVELAVQRPDQPPATRMPTSARQSTDDRNCHASRVTAPLRRVKQRAASPQELPIRRERPKPTSQPCYNYNHQRMLIATSDNMW